MTDEQLKEALVLLAEITNEIDRLYDNDTLSFQDAANVEVFTDELKRLLYRIHRGEEKGK